MIIRLLAALGATSIALILPMTASAQDAPSYATQDQQIHGRVVGFDGEYSLRVRDDHGYVDNVQLHQGTVINPTGLTLAAGMVVSVNGYNQGGYFAANEIDTPYLLSGPVPYYGGHPWNYYGPSVSLGFFFGSAGWWHGGYYGHPVYVNGGYYGRPVYVNHPVYVNGGGYHAYHVTAPYRGGAFHGRDYVARPEHGGYVPHQGNSSFGHGPSGHVAPAAHGGQAGHGHQH